ncbi:MAG: hypothetical protein OXL41_02720, partial [Nitrospinae bacterium]|nr:hypothetical protein [Nitrospinota bacterium]
EKQIMVGPLANRILRPFSDSRGFPTVKKTFYRVGIIEKGSLFLFSLGIRWLKDVIKTKAGEFKLSRGIERSCRAG